MIHRRQFNQIALSLLATAAIPPAAQAFTATEASLGLKTTLEKGALAAVSTLGQTDGFWGNDLVRIPLPAWIEKSRRILRFAGYGDTVDALHEAMNRAAESAVPEAKTLLVGAVKKLTVKDAKKILEGGDTAVTDFFAEKTKDPLSQRFQPMIAKALENVGAVRHYNSLAQQVVSLGLVREEDANLNSYVTRKAVDGLFTMIRQEEIKIRQDPIGTGSAILKKIFGQ